ncbi:MAG: nucleoside phosphorylase [Thermodesulfobacteriota bacterium]
MNIPTSIPKNAQGRFYHIDCLPGDLAPYILTCGDPHRAQRIARRFTRIDLRRKNREFLTYTGSYKNLPVSVMATGIGAPATAIAVVEAANCINPVTFIRLGTCGALQWGIEVGDLVITESAWCREGTVASYVPAGIVPHADPMIVAALTEAAEALKMPYHVGLTLTTGDFYAGQGRAAPGFPAPDPQYLHALTESGVLNMEMEMAVYLALAAVSTYQVRAGGACLVLDNRESEAGFTSVKDKQRGEGQLISVGLRALEILAKRDQQTK